MSVSKIKINSYQYGTYQIAINYFSNMILLFSTPENEERRNDLQIFSFFQKLIIYF